MSQKTVDALTERFSGRTAEESGNKRRPSRKSETPEKPAKNLDDAVTQDQIFNPLPIKLKLEDGYELTLNEPSMKLRRRIFGWAMRVVGDAGSLPGAGLRIGILEVRIISLLNSREDLESDMYFLSAKLFGAPGEVSDDQAREFAAEIDSHAMPKDAGTLFKSLCIIAGADFSKN